MGQKHLKKVKTTPTSGAPRLKFFMVNLACPAAAANVRQKVELTLLKF